jgi:hypothetical protein
MHLSLRLDPGSEEPVLENEGKIVVAACLYFGPIVTKEGRTRKNVCVKYTLFLRFLFELDIF